MADNGYIALPRQMQNHPFWTERREFSKAEAWIDLIWLARWSDEPNETLVGMTLVTTGRGQLFHSIRTLSTRWGWSKSTTQRFLSLLQSWDMIRIESGSRLGQITIVDYDRYSARRDDLGTTMGQTWDDDGTQVGHKEEGEEGKEGEEGNKSAVDGDLFSKREKPTTKRKAPKLPAPAMTLADMPEGIRTAEVFSAWQDWEAHRKAIRKPLTQLAIKLQLDRMVKWGPVASIASIHASIGAGWSDLYEPKPQGHNHNGKPRDNYHEPDFDYDELARIAEENRKSEDTKGLPL